MIFRRCGFLWSFCLSIPIVFCLIPFIITPAYAAKTIPLGREPVDLALQDLNGDGHRDIVVVDEVDGYVSVLMGNGDGTFQEPVNYSGVGEHAACVAIGDVNGDDKLDLIVTNHYDETSFFVLSGNGDGTFQDPVGFPHHPFVLNKPGSVALGDLNGDGNLDLVMEISAAFLKSLAVLLGNGDGTFQDPVTYRFEGLLMTNFVTLEDLNGDDNLDVIVALCSNDIHKVGVMLGKGDGAFQDAVTYEVGGEWPEHIAVGYLDGDVNLDLAVTNFNSGDVSVLLGKGDGTFQNAVTYDADLSNPESVAIGDLNDDGHVDLAVANRGGDRITVLLGKGDGTFEEGGLNYQSRSNPVDVALGDLDGDGFLDIVAANQDTPVFHGNVSIFTLRLLSPTDGATIPGLSTFKWTPGVYDKYLVYSKFFYSIDIEVGPFTYTFKFYFPITFWMENNSGDMVDEWWDYLDTSLSHYWRILGYNETTENFDITETWSFKKAP